MIKVFARVGESAQHVGAICPAGFIEMVDSRPGLYNNALSDGTWGPDRGPTSTCSKRQGELALLTEPSPNRAHPSFLHWLEAGIDAETDPIEKRRKQAYFNAAEWRSDDPFVMGSWEAGGRDLSELPALFERAVTL